tara:strand:+ start:274 stop:729 length:456 start_codon:yes stop_codon:yes gene_type:complete
MNEDEKWMRVAISEAKLAKSKGEVPVGAVLIQDGNLIVSGHNQSIINNDPTAHAEINVLRKAGKKLNNYRLINTSIYVTLEPCAMCLGAMMHARIDQIIYGALDPKTGVCGTCANLTSEIFFNHKINSKGGILEKECRLLLQSFFKLKRDN